MRSFLSPLEVLVHGNEVLGGVIEGYDRDKVRGQADHNVDNIVTVIERWFREGRAREVASLRFVGYLVLDALVGNTDRHHENWGLRLLLSSKVVDEENLGTGIDIEIAPTFDHASSLGRELLDEKRRAILDNSVGLRRYIRKAKGGIFRDRCSERSVPSRRFGVDRREISKAS